MIQNEFVPYETAKQMAELGFDEECLAGYDPYFNPPSLVTPNNKGRYMKTYSTNRYVLRAATWNQAFKFLTKLQKNENDWEDLVNIAKEEIEKLSKEKNGIQL